MLCIPNLVFRYPVHSECVDSFSDLHEGFNVRDEPVQDHPGHRNHFVTLPTKNHLATPCLDDVNTEKIRKNDESGLDLHRVTQLIISYLFVTFPRPVFDFMIYMHFLFAIRHFRIWKNVH